MERPLGFTLPAGEQFLPNGEKTRLRSNLSAIKILREVQQSKRALSADEAKVLAGFAGWGSLKTFFDPIFLPAYLAAADAGSFDPHQFVRTRPEYMTWAKEIGPLAKELYETLSEGEFAAARQSTLNAHYTGEVVGRFLWDVLERAGFAGGNVLEPGCGTGQLIALMPRKWRATSRVVAIERDGTAAAICEALHGSDVKVVTGALEDATAWIPDASFDVVIANPPFSSGSIAHRFPDEPTLNLHNFFLREALEKLRPGGLLVAVVTHATLDNQPEQRAVLAKKAHLLGVVRLPSCAFARVANTEVVTDVILLQRRRPNEADRGMGWGAVAIREIEGKRVNVNEAIAGWPQRIIGSEEIRGGMYGAGDEYTVEFDGDFPEALAEKLNLFPAGIAQGEAEDWVPVPVRIASKQTVEGFEWCRTESEPFVVGARRNGIITPPPWRNSDGTPNQERRAGWAAELDSMALAFIALAEAYDVQVAMDLSAETTEAESADGRAVLRARYSEFVGAWGTLGQNPVLERVLADDMRLMSLRALEESGPDGSLQMGRFLLERQLYPAARPMTANTLKEALQIVRSEVGRIDIGRIAQLVDRSPETTTAELVKEGLAFRDPVSGILVVREEYLSGFVVDKLERAIRAQAAAETARAAGQPAEDYSANVAALSAVVPVRVSLADRDAQMQSPVVTLGASWVPASVVKAFAKACLGQDDRFEVEHVAALGRWFINQDTVTRISADAVVFSVADAHVGKALEKVLNRGSSRVTRNNKGVVIEDKAASQDLAGLLDRIRGTFREWMFEHEQAGLLRELELRFNRQFNSFVPRVCDGSHLTFPGLTKSFQPRQVQKDAVARVLEEGRAALALGVGFGKTATIAIAAMEMVRTGMAKRPMIVADNPSYGQFVDQVSRLYPQARILAVRNEDLGPAKRMEFLARARHGGWDLLICSRTQFSKISLRAERYLDYWTQSLRELETQFAFLKSQSRGRLSGNTRKIEKILERRREDLTEKLEALREHHDEGLTFEDLRIDALFLDEAHQYYRRAPLMYPGDPIKGLPTGESQRAIDAMLKARVVGRNIILATGTPLNNTTAEVYSMMRLCAPDVLEGFGLRNFAEFLYAFCVERKQLECEESTMEWREVVRLAAFKNGPELSRLTRSVMEIRLNPQACGIEVPELRGGGYQMFITPRTPAAAAVQEYLADVRKGWEELTAEERADNPSIPILTLQAALTASIDPRLIDRNAHDDPRSLVNEIVRAAVEIYAAEYAAGRRPCIPIFVGRYRPYASEVLASFAHYALGEGALAGARDRAGAKAAALAAIGDDQAVSGEEEEVQEDFLGELALPPEDRAQAAALQAEQRMDKVAAWSFNLQHDIRLKILAELRRRDLPAPESCVVAACDLDNKQLRDVCERADRGEVAFLIGSHARIGIGLNYQRVQCAQFHTIPSDLVPTTLTQARGRAERQGNSYKTIDILLTGMQDTAAVGIWSRLKTKERMKEQVLSGETVGLEFEDPASELNCDEFMAGLVSDSRQRQRADLLQTIREEQLRLQVERRRLAELEYKVHGMQQNAGYYRGKVATAGELAAVLRTTQSPLERSVGALTWAWSTNGQVRVQGEGSCEAVRKQLEELLEHLRESNKSHQYAGANRILGKLKLGGLEAWLTWDVPLGDVKGWRFVLEVINPKNSAEPLQRSNVRGVDGLFRTFHDARGDALGYHERMQRALSSATADAESVRRELDRLSEKPLDASVLRNAEIELRALEQDMATNPAPRARVDLNAQVRRIMADGSDFLDWERLCRLGASGLLKWLEKLNAGGQNDLDGISYQAATAGPSEISGIFGLTGRRV